jgi:hypothetical protein
LLREDEKFRPLLDRLGGTNEFLETSFRALLDRMRTEDAELVQEISTSSAPRPEIRTRASVPMRN